LHGCIAGFIWTFSGRRMKPSGSLGTDRIGEAIADAREAILDGGWPSSPPRPENGSVAGSVDRGGSARLAITAPALAATSARFVLAHNTDGQKSRVKMAVDSFI
jgi:hypothetical protein